MTRETEDDTNWLTLSAATERALSKIKQHAGKREAKKSKNREDECDHDVAAAVDARQTVGTEN
jgi:hypothetical protein